MFGKLIRGAVLFTAGVAGGAGGAMWLVADAGKEVRGELGNLASKAKNKVQECCEKMKQEVEAATKVAEKDQPAAKA